LNPLPYLIVLATSANAGSALTLTGNPQNMIVGSLSGIDFLKFISFMAVPVCVAMFINALLAWLFYRHDLELENTKEVDCDAATDLETIEKTRSLRIGLLGLGVACAGFVSGFSMAFSALGGAVVVITFHRKDPTELLNNIEWSLLLFFASLFVVIGGLQTSGLAKLMTDYSLQIISGEQVSRVWLFSGVTLAGSNLLSNVPFVLLASSSVPSLGNPELFWCLLAYVSTIAGNMTLFSSVANLIVAETAKESYSISFWEFARFGIPATLISGSLGILILLQIF
jgi:Na+/H+ antiporter NhaD/arsenite permease-like protein